MKDLFNKKRIMLVLFGLDLAALAVMFSVINPTALTVAAPLANNENTEVNTGADSYIIEDSPGEGPDLAPKHTELSSVFPSEAEGMDLGDLYVLDKLFDNGSPALLDEGTTSLKDLLIVDYLFNNGILFGNGQYGYKDLFVIDRLLGDGNGLLDSGATSLSDLIILEQLFNGGR